MSTPRCRKPVWTRTFINWDQIPVLMTVQEACILLRMSDQTVRNWIKNGTLRGITVGASIRVEKQSVIDLITGGNIS